MTKPPKIVPELKHALEIFLKELDTHLDFFSTTVGEMKGEIAEEEKSPRDAAASKAKALEHRFHLIKGGAGFLQLADMQQTAVEGETMFKHGEVHSEDDSTLVESLEKLVRSLESQKQAVEDLDKD